MKNSDDHFHPLSHLCVYGSQLEPGDVLTETDVYDSSSGFWEPAPIHGLPIGEGNDAVWIRPEKDERID